MATYLAAAPKLPARDCSSNKSIFAKSRPAIAAYRAMVDTDRGSLGLISFAKARTARRQTNSQPPGFALLKQLRQPNERNNK